MKKKRWLLAAIGLASLIGLPILVIALLPNRPGVTRANFHRIAIGMTKPDVENIFGGEPAKRMPRHLRGKLFVWFNDDGRRAAEIFFDEQGQVSDKEWRDWTLLGRVREEFPWFPF